MQAVILAAGKGTRFHSDQAKVLHTIGGKSLVSYVVKLADALKVSEKIVVIGHQGEKVKEEILRERGVRFVWQREQHGTGHAVMMAVPYLRDDDVLVLYGDVPALRVETIATLIAAHRKEKNAVTILTAKLAEPKWYGRILKDAKGKVLGIREAKDATEEELKIKEINSGILVVHKDFLVSALEKLQCGNGQCEYYLTDIVEMACREGKNVGTVLVKDTDEIKGVNSLVELEEMQRILEKRYVGKRKK